MSEGLPEGPPPARQPERSKVVWVPLDSLRLDPELQPRAEIDKKLMEEYAQHLKDGVAFPPVIAFDDGETLWLADGFHRWHVRKELGYDAIEVAIFGGDRTEALRHSLAANATHGARRGNADYRRAYAIACENGLVDPADSEGVRALLHCSGRWADELTADARMAARAERDAEISAKKAEGKSNRAIAREVGIDRRTVDRTVGAKARAAQTPRPHRAPPAKPDWMRGLDEVESPAARAWAEALAAIRTLNEQASVDFLYDNRFAGLDHMLSVEIEKAAAWISELHRRFARGGTP